ncbi:MAG: M23 family metallopeptidase [Bacilli bacterium]|nr:M23 family metallopeptidase [Bacilli bacterium]
MSKNGNLLFRGFNPYITSSFGFRVHPITKLRTLHAGVDYGTNNQKISTYAIESGKVLKTGFSNISGNFVYVYFPRLGKVGLYQHLDSISVKTDQEVNENTIIGVVGETGEVTGIHLHFGWFNLSEYNKGWYDRNWEDFEEYNYIPEVIYLGNPVMRDLSRSQIEVIISNLRVRKSPNGEILGLINPGIYNILDSEVLEDYTWYKINLDMWIAYSPEFANIYLVLEENMDLEDPYEDIKEELPVLEPDVDEVIDSEIVEDDSETEKVSVFERIFQVFQEIIEKILNLFRKV